MVDRQALRFRRHLAACVLVVLAAEVPFGAKQWLAQRPSTADEQPYVARYTRIKLASAASTENISSSNNATLDRYRRHYDATLEPPSAAAETSIDDLNHLYNYDVSQENTGLVNELLALIGTHLPVIDLNFTLSSTKRKFVNEQLDKDVDDYYAEKFKSNSTLDEYQLLSVKAATRVVPMPLHTSWGYRTRDQMLQGSLPVKNDHLCRIQLAHLTKRLEASLTKGAALSQPTQGDDPSGGASVASPVSNFEARQIYLSHDLDFWRYMDTFGRVEADLLRGNIRWTGSYIGCVDTKLTPSPAETVSLIKNQQQWRSNNWLMMQNKLRTGETASGVGTMKFRYCLGSLRSRSWPPDEDSTVANDDASTAGTNYGTGSRSSGSGSLNARPVDYRVSDAGARAAAGRVEYFVRVGLCVPEACDSSALEPSAGSQAAESNALASLQGSRPEPASNRYNLERLVKFNLAKPFDSDHYYLSGLYCLPDNRSPLRRIPLAGKLLLVLIAGWLALIGSATLVHLNVERFYAKTVEKIRRQQLVEQQKQRRRQRARHSHPADESNSDEDELSSEADLNDESRNDDADEDSKKDTGEQHESDFLQLRHYWIRFNVYVWDKSRTIVKGVDLIACLSLYSNWLRYTYRCKLAIAQLYAEEQRLDKERLHNEQLVKRARLAKVSNSKKKQAEAEAEADAAAAVTSSTDEQDTSEPQQLESAASKPEVADATQTRIVDTSSLNALKVVALIWIIAGHCVFYMGSIVSNAAILKNYVKTVPSFALANGAMYITELFFVITGCLTAYLTFKHNSTTVTVEDSLDSVQMKPLAVGKKSDNSTNNNMGAKNTTKNRKAVTIVKLRERLFSSLFWLLLIVHRYLRIVPTYVLIYALVKLVTLYIGGEGPLWDYAVSPDSMRLACSQESWLPVLTLTTNFNDIYKHCIIGGWYLSTDMQFAIISAPLLLVLAMCQRSLRQDQAAKTDTNNVHEERERFTDQSSTKLTIMTTHKSGSQIDIADNKRTGEMTGSGASDTRLVAVASKRLFNGYGLILAFGAFSGLLSMLYGLWQQQVDLSYMLKFAPHSISMLSRIIALYTNSIFRFRAFALGMILGHILYLYEFRLIKLPKFIQLHGSKLIVIIFIAGFATMFAPVLYPRNKILISHEVTSIMAVVSAGAIDVFLCIMIFLLCINKAPKLVLFILNSPFWSLFSTLSLSAFLIHAEIIIILSSQFYPPPSTSYSVLLFLFAATIIITYALALALYLSFELPVSRLIESIMKKYLVSMASKKGLSSDLDQPPPPPSTGVVSIRTDSKQ